jgi:hypothetical protein
VLAALNHPNIAAIHGIEYTDGLPALVLELVEGMKPRIRKASSIAISNQRTSRSRPTAR